MTCFAFAISSACVALSGSCQPNILVSNEPRWSNGRMYRGLSKPSIITSLLIERDQNTGSNAALRMPLSHVFSAQLHFEVDERGALGGFMNCMNFDAFGGNRQVGAQGSVSRQPSFAGANRHAEPCAAARSHTPFTLPGNASIS